MIAEAFASVLQRCQSCFQAACAAGWLEPEDMQRLAAVERATPADLFRDQATRPLVVAFFGGTGVGKSSLLNRLAGAEIARTGAERPTSRAATLYVHESVALADLPPDLPLDRVQIHRHACDRQREIMWLDAPDIDSVEQSNRQAALAWLPHVDLVCYVVSPERYRDDAGWRVLRERGYKHGWVFVINRWDEGDRRQVDDLRSMLRAAGFDDPLILCTCCRPGRSLPSEDEFGQLQRKLSEVLEAHGIAELARLGYRARLQDLQSVLAAAAKKLGHEHTWAEVLAEALAAWDRTAAAIRTGMSWSLGAAAARCAAGSRGLLAAFGWKTTYANKPAGATASVDQNQPPDVLETVLEGLWDEWAQSKVTAWIDSIEVRAAGADLTPTVLRSRLTEAGATCEEVMRAHFGDGVRQALARPGTAFGRLLRRGTGFLTAFLPAAAILWVAWRVVQGYYEAGTGSKPFLGMDFAIHSGLLVLLAWAVPFTADRLLRPSPDQTIRLGLERGLNAGLEALNERFRTALNEVVGEAGRFRGELQSLQTVISGLLVRPVDAREPTLARLLSRAARPATPEQGAASR